MAPSRTACAALSKESRLRFVNDTKLNRSPGVEDRDPEEWGAKVVAISSLLVLGSAAAKFAAGEKAPLPHLSTLPNNLRTASVCPFRESGIPLPEVAAFATNPAQIGAKTRNAVTFILHTVKGKGWQRLLALE